jgi:exonuclease 3'-5' domain-containing protein 1
MNTVEESVIELFMDVEGGQNHGRNGNLNFIQILRVSTGRLWLLDIKAIGTLPFHIKCHFGKQQSIADIFENLSIPIIVFDCRSNSDSLNANILIRLRGVIDLQLMEAVTRNTCRKFLYGLDKCIAGLWRT